MGKNNKNIIVKNNFDYYKKIGSTAKKLEDDVIIISQRHDHVNRDKGEVALKTIVSEALRLEVEASNISNKDFKFKIFDREFMPQPCYRFDSDGEAHNNLGDIPLRERQVTTPHFHKFNEDGNEIAYKTTALKEKENVLDRKLGMVIFAKEENIVCDNIPEIRRDGELIQPENVVIDPLQGEQFYE